jgi:peptidoglycan hydrolase CwlO-like protein
MEPDAKGEVLCTLHRSIRAPRKGALHQLPSRAPKFQKRLDLHLPRQEEKRMNAHPEYEVLQKKNDELTDEIDFLKKEIERKDDDIDDYKKEIAQMEQEIDDLKEEVKKKAAEIWELEVGDP